jgi:hypothetical protein
VSRLALALTVLLMAATGRVAAADADAAAHELAVNIQCQSQGRTKSCPTFLLGMLDAQPRVRQAPRAAADVILYFNATIVASTDVALLRFVGDIDGAPRELELTVDIDSRGTDDEQIAQLRPALLRGLARYVAARDPAGVTTAIAVPAGAAARAAGEGAGSPWAESVTLGGNGSWTESYSSVLTNARLDLIREHTDSEIILDISGSYGFERRPPLIVDGQEVSIDSDQYTISLFSQYTRNLNRRWAVGASINAVHEDPAGQHRLMIKPALGVEWDLYTADNPRGNRLAIAYNLGFVHADYNVANELGEKVADYPYHFLGAAASVRKDKVSYGLYLGLTDEILHPSRRYSLSLSPSITVQLGDHVDFNLTGNVTKRELPGPDIDQASFNQLLRASYAEPLSADLSFNVTLHWDATNGARNDRFDGLL